MWLLENLYTIHNNLQVFFSFSKIFWAEISSWWSDETVNDDFSLQIWALLFICFLFFFRIDFSIIFFAQFQHRKMIWFHIEINFCSNFIQTTKLLITIFGEEDKAEHQGRTRGNRRKYLLYCDENYSAADFCQKFWPVFPFMIFCVGSVEFHSASFSCQLAFIGYFMFIWLSSVLFYNKLQNQILMHISSVLFAFIM